MNKIECNICEKKDFENNFIKEEKCEYCDLNICLECEKNEEYFVDSKQNICWDCVENHGLNCCEFCEKYGDLTELIDVENNVTKYFCCSCINEKSLDYCYNDEYYYKIYVEDNENNNIIECFECKEKIDLKKYDMVKYENDTCLCSECINEKIYHFHT